MDGRAAGRDRAKDGCLLGNADGFEPMLAGIVAKRSMLVKRAMVALWNELETAVISVHLLKSYPKADDAEWHSGAPECLVLMPRRRQAQGRLYHGVIKYELGPWPHQLSRHGRAIAKEAALPERRLISRGHRDLRESGPTIVLAGKVEVIPLVISSPRLEQTVVDRDDTRQLLSGGNGRDR